MLAALSRSARLAWSPSSGAAAVPALPRWASVAPSRGKKKKAKGKSGGGSGKAAAIDIPDDAPVDLKPFEENMRTTVEGLRTTYARIRSATAAPDMLDDIAVETGGARTPLRSVAQVASRDGRNLFVTVFDEKSVGDVERAVRNAGLNLNPISEGRGILRIPVGKPSMETRNAMKEIAHKEGEAAKVAARLVRRRALDRVKKVKEEVADDEVKRLERAVQGMTERWVDEISQMQKSKIEAIMNMAGRK